MLHNSQLLTWSLRKPSSSAHDSFILKHTKNEGKWENTVVILLIQVCAQVGLNQATYFVTVRLKERILIDHNNFLICVKSASGYIFY
jgi:hypothetical protein